MNYQLLLYSVSSLAILFSAGCDSQGGQSYQARSSSKTVSCSAVFLRDLKPGFNPASINYNQYSGEEINRAFLSDLGYYAATYHNINIDGLKYKDAEKLWIILDGYIAFKSINQDSFSRETIELFVISRVPSFRTFVSIRLRTGPKMGAENIIAAQCDQDWLSLSKQLPLISYIEHREQISFKGYSCTVDCSGHKAGYEWASSNYISDKNNCSGNNRSFIEGCWAWVDSQ